MIVTEEMKVNQSYSVNVLQGILYVKNVATKPAWPQSIHVKPYRRPGYSILTSDKIMTTE